MAGDMELTQIDVDEVLRKRIPHRYRYIPRFLISWLARAIHQDELNAILRHMAAQPGGIEAADVAMSDLQVTATLVGIDNVPAGGRYIFASNHPLGGLDGLSLISALGHKYDGKIRFLVNDLLMAVQPLQPVFLPVNKYGRQSRGNAAEIERQYRSDNQMVTFPAGLCSRMDAHGVVRDLPWHKMVVTHAVSSRRDVVPVYFEGENSRHFYRMARLRKRLGIKFNYEMVYLPGEMFKCRGANFKVHVGKPVPWQSLDAAHPAQEALRLQQLAYSLNPAGKTMQSN